MGNKNGETSERTGQETPEKILDDVTKKYDQTVEQGARLGKDTLTKIEKNTRTGIEFIKSRPYWDFIRNNSLKIKEKSVEQRNVIKKQSPKFYKKITSGFFYFFEAVTGRIKIGTQYGNPSMELLERLAKLKELGILTDEEFTKKKKKLLDRI